ncbi:LuxR family two component transcriptional regulator [Chitinophaga skermanii]|uniref:LuxR family two component transcriptional regulator n=1 Tax=Chitinophaga skermanii TaxID=331697 RepID=A0A327R274_9BACT|nr:response regulator transcription factor [Chitinophaga skermanii]RAJ10760.1 LuxR family two component transcriptional regulator [Chitinophaga skermanii]
MKIKVAIVDDHVMVINGLTTMLAPYPQIEIVFTARDGETFLDEVAVNPPDVLLLDIQMPGIDGMEVCKRVRKQDDQLRVIALTNFTESHYIKQMLRNGASGYLLKNTDEETLIDAIEKVYMGQQYLDESIKHSLLNEIITGQKRSTNGIPLTRREKEILQLITEELTNQEIADKLYISLRTVETHRLNLTQKLAVKNTAGLVKEAMKRGLLE